jgi:hypothetical protein
MRALTEGSSIQIAYDGETVPGEIFLSSASGLLYDAPASRAPSFPILRVMPIVWIEPEFVDSFHAETVTILV